MNNATLWKELKWTPLCCRLTGEERYFSSQFPPLFSYYFLFIRVRLPPCSTLHLFLTIFHRPTVFFLPQSHFPSFPSIFFVGLLRTWSFNRFLVFFSYCVIKPSTVLSDQIFLPPPPSPSFPRFFFPSVYLLYDLLIGSWFSFPSMWSNYLLHFPTTFSSLHLQFPSFLQSSSFIWSSSWYFNRLQLSSSYYLIKPSAAFS